MGTKVPLGELRTDDQGRLIVLGGFGSSASYLKKPATTFANNDGWHDDTSDGWVRATVTIGGKKLEAEPAAVAVTPPNFGPGLYGVVTMYDVVYDLFCRDPKFAFDPPARPSFWRHIYPMLARLVDTGWVNSGADVLFGPGSPSHLTTPELLTQLADPAAEFQALRTAYASWFRDPAAKTRRADAREAAARSTATRSATTAGSAWTTSRSRRPSTTGCSSGPTGDFDPDPSLRQRPATLADYPLADQPRALDEANLESCLGGPFHPGIELTWTLRVASDVEGAVPAQPGRRGRRAEDGLRRDPDPDGGARRGRCGVGLGARHADLVDGGAVADRRGELPVGLRGRHLPPATVVLGGAGSQPGPQPALVRAA